MTADHLVPKVTDRGFRHLPTVTDTLDGTVRVYESSSAEGAHVWLNLTDRIDGEREAVAHLTIDQARQVADQLNWLADHHYQNDVAP